MWRNYQPPPSLSQLLAGRGGGVRDQVLGWFDTGVDLLDPDDPSRGVLNFHLFRRVMCLASLAGVRLEVVDSV